MASAVFGAAAADPLGEAPAPLVRVRGLGIRHPGATLTVARPDLLARALDDVPGSVV